MAGFLERARLAKQKRLERESGEKVRFEEMQRQEKMQEGLLHDNQKEAQKLKKLAGGFFFDIFDAFNEVFFDGRADVPKELDQTYASSESASVHAVTRVPDERTYTLVNSDDASLAGEGDCFRLILSKKSLSKEIELAVAGVRDDDYKAFIINGLSKQEIVDQAGEIAQFLLKEGKTRFKF